MDYSQKRPLAEPIVSLIIVSICAEMTHHFEINRFIIIILHLNSCIVILVYCKVSACLTNEKPAMCHEKFGKEMEKESFM